MRLFMNIKNHHPDSPYHDKPSPNPYNNESDTTKKQSVVDHMLVPDFFNSTSFPDATGGNKKAHGGDSGALYHLSDGHQRRTPNMMDQSNHANFPTLTRRQYGFIPNIDGYGGDNSNTTTSITSKTSDNRGAFLYHPLDKREEMTNITEHSNHANFQKCGQYGFIPIDGDDDDNIFLDSITVCPSPRKRKANVSSILEMNNSNNEKQDSNLISGITRRAVIPADLDVLFGRGYRKNKHPGNERFRKIVNEMIPIYIAQGGSKKRKNELSKQVMETVYAYGGRFLEEVANADLWENTGETIFVEVDKKRARKKCSQRLREKMKIGKKMGSK